ncbi:hypothetical protein [Azospirillum rugosum]|uniref:Uncharacterized membrane protein YidH (DUF202 family) n=1 Tax=Azospirillum rugosum TaxID=416170 RepID=A0ABS4SPT9_9PROT|nr:hypothetical protein [Azospirillum rugosum]MBP2294477.1 uncharacterized membrane protein YidH (DUF202 family) [Azospirillum rugosum]MDQ0528982.1 uncharacterized membrane protein YidH (DUF202 family) [Azospirillum rugosum]
MTGTPDSPAKPAAKPARKELPPGYRQGIITAVTVILGFSLVFLRFWSFEAEGAWTVPSVIAAVILAVSILFQMVCLWRSLQLSDDDEAEYAKTLRWFLASIVTLLVSVLIAALAYSGLFRG